MELLLLKSATLRAGSINWCAWQTRFIIAEFYGYRSFFLPFFSPPSQCYQVSPGDAEKCYVAGRIQELLRVADKFHHSGILWIPLVLSPLFLPPLTVLPGVTWWCWKVLRCGQDPLIRYQFAELLYWYRSHFGSRYHLVTCYSRSIFTFLQYGRPS